MILERSAAKGCLSRRLWEGGCATMRAAILGCGKGWAFGARKKPPGGGLARERRGSHVVDHHLAEARAADLRGPVHEAGEVVGHLLRQDRLLERADDQVGRLRPAHVA